MENENRELSNVAKQQSGNVARRTSRVASISRQVASWSLPYVNVLA